MPQPNETSADLGQAEQWVSDTLRLLQEAQKKLNLRTKTREHPYAMVLAAAGAGYILAGGLLTPLTARMLKMGLRLAAIPLLQEEWQTHVQTLWDKGPAAVEVNSPMSPDDLFE